MKRIKLHGGRSSTVSKPMLEDFYSDLSVIWVEKDYYVSTSLFDPRADYYYVEGIAL